MPPDGPSIPLRTQLSVPNGESLRCCAVPVSDEDSDAMVDDPNDEDFVPFRTRRSTRMSLRAQTAQRAARSVAKMTCANCRTPLQKGQTAYQRKGLPQLFCSSSCLTTFSRRPHGKKICTFCKKCVIIPLSSVILCSSPHAFSPRLCDSHVSFVTSVTLPAVTPCLLRAFPPPSTPFMLLTVSPCLA